MSDKRLRREQRQFERSEAPIDERKALRERLRVGEKLPWDLYCRLVEVSEEWAEEYLQARSCSGELSDSALEVAALCGHAPAQSWARVDARSIPAEEWFECLLEADLNAGVLAVMVALEGVLASEGLAEDVRGAVSRQLSSIGRWIDCPCEEHRELVEASNARIDRDWIIRTVTVGSAVTVGRSLGLDRSRALELLREATEERVLQSLLC